MFLSRFWGSREGKFSILRSARSKLIALKKTDEFNKLLCIDAPLFFCSFHLPCMPYPCENICNVCSFDGSPLELLVVLYVGKKNLSGKMLIRFFANLISAFLSILVILGIVSSFFLMNILVIIKQQNCGNILEKFWSHLLFSNYFNILVILL